MCPFVVSRMPARVPDRTQPERVRPREASARALRTGIDVLIVLLRLSNAYSLQPVIDAIVLLLADFAGIMRVSPLSIFSSLLGILP